MSECSICHKEIYPMNNVYPNMKDHSACQELPEWVKAKLHVANDRVKELEAENSRLMGLLEIAIPYVEERFGTVDKLIRNSNLQQFYIQEYAILNGWLGDEAIASIRLQSREVEDGKD